MPPHRKLTRHGKAKKTKKKIGSQKKQRRNAIERHNRNAAELSRHYIEWSHTHLECKDCGCKSTDENFKLMIKEQCGWHHYMKLNWGEDAEKRKSKEQRWARRAHDTKQCMTIWNVSAAFTWLAQSSKNAAVT